ncbi:MAG: hypothetical protein NC931_00985 [Candidatus Omnitrophica bacterium]|nr:hypothetical protein [Candidatus Omnitrophota bacterium]
MREREKLINCIELKGDGEIFSSVSVIGTIWDSNKEYFEEKVKKMYPCFNRSCQG